MRSSRFGFVFVLALVLLGLPAACATPTPTATPRPTATPTPTASPLPIFTPQPATGSATLAAQAAPEHLDVHQAASDVLLSMGPGIVYSRLLRLRTGPGAPSPSLEVECDLCQAWEQTSPTTYVFHLRQGVRWQDVPPLNGRVLTAQDVTYSLDRLRTPGWPGAALLQAVASVQASDDRTVQVTLRYADADFPLALAHGQSKIVAKEAVEQHGDLKAGPAIGTGPWVLEASGPEGSQYSANPSYFEPGVPGLERLRIQVVGEASTRMILVLVGRVDVTVLDDRAWETLRGMSDETRVMSGVFPLPGTGLLLGLQAIKPPFDRLEVRQALYQSLHPWKALATPGWEGRGEVQAGSPPASVDWKLSQEEMQAYFGDSAKAQTLLAQSGVKTPVAFTLSLADFGDKYLALGNAYADMMRQAGFQPALETLNPREYADQVWNRRDFQAFLGPMPPVYSPNGFLVGMAHSQGQYAITGYVNPELDALILRQFSAGDDREELVRQTQRLMLQKAFLFMPASGVSLWMWREHVQGFAPNLGASEYFYWAKMRVGE